MKKINSIWYGSTILAACGIFAVVIPLVFILIMFSLMLAVEFKQDKKIQLKYNKVKYQKVEISDGLYECQYCGNQNVGKEDLFCKVCATKFNMEN